MKGRYLVVGMKGCEMGKIEKWEVFGDKEILEMEGFEKGTLGFILIEIKKKAKKKEIGRKLNVLEKVNF